MSIRYVGCLGTDRLADHGLYRLTFVPANSIVGALMSRWPDACYGVFDAIAGGFCYPIQGTPTILDSDTVGKVCVFDVKVRADGIGAALSELARLANDCYPTTMLAQVEAIGIKAAASPDAGAAQTVTGEAVAEQVAAESVGTTVKSVAKWAMIALVLIAVIVVASKAPKVA